MFLFDLFPGWTIEEIVRINELFFMGMLVLAACFVVGDNPHNKVTVASKF